MNITYTTIVPAGVDPVISLGTKTLAGALSVGDAVGLEQNPAAKIQLDLYDLSGDPATPLVPGKQAKYVAQKLAVKAANDAARAAVHNGREYCRLAIGVLKPTLGNRWNTQWNAAGFAVPSLAIPNDPVPMLIRFREYFNANPAREVAVLNVTAARAQLRVTEIQQAHVTLSQARNLRIDFKAARDESLKKLRQRLIGLRGELDQIIEDDDGRWYDFGFRRPADGQQPAPVTGLVLTPGGAGIVLASWAASTNAENYRLTWKPTSSAGEPTEVGLTAETQFALTGLPSGLPISVGVSARNAAGETLTTEVTIVVP